MKRIGLLSVAFAAMMSLACGGDARRDDVNDPEAVGTAGEARDDRGSRNFVEEMLNGGMAEIELSKIATQRTRNPEVKKFAETLVRDHTKAANDLKQVATRHNIQPPTALNEDAREEADRLNKLAVAEFDKQYVQEMIDRHENSVDKLESRVDGNKRTNEGRSADVRPEKSDNTLEAGANTWAAAVLPTVRQHLEMAKDLNNKLSRRTTY
jgi:putative membrane protein